MGIHVAPPEMAATATIARTADLIEALARRAWEIASAHAADCPPLDLLTRLTDAPSQASSDGPRGAADQTDRLEHLATVSFLADDTIQSFARGARAILRDLARELSQTAQVQLAEGRVPAGFVDWPATLRRRLSAVGEVTAVVISRTEVNRDLPETRLLKFLLGEVHRRAGAALAASGRENRRSSTEELAAQTGKLAAHPALRVVPAMSTRQGYLHAKASLITGYRTVARAYELHQALFGPGDRDLLLALFHRCLSSPRSDARAFAIRVLFQVMARIEAHGARRVSVHVREPGQGLTFVFVGGARQWDVHFQHVPPSLFDAGAAPALAAAAGSTREAALPEIVVHVSGGESSEQTLLLATQHAPTAETVRQRLHHVRRTLLPFLRTGDPHTSLLLVVGATPASSQGWAGALGMPFSGQVTDLDGLDVSLEARNLVTPKPLYPTIASASISTFQRGSSSPATTTMVLAGSTLPNTAP